MIGLHPSDLGRAVFLDRDGVLIPDEDGPPKQIVLLPGVAEATRALREAGFVLVVVTNQPAVARGLCSEGEVRQLHAELCAALAEGGGGVDDIRFCPHHPKATDSAYRVECTCRKPKPGMICDAALAIGLELGRSFLVGDRPSDVIAGAAAGCRTVLVETGKHLDAPIFSSESLPPAIPDFVGPDLAAAARWIVAQPR